MRTPKALNTLIYPKICIYHIITVSIVYRKHAIPIQRRATEIFIVTLDRDHTVYIYIYIFKWTFYDLCSAPFPSVPSSTEIDVIKSREFDDHHKSGNFRNLPRFGPSTKTVRTERDKRSDRREKPTFFSFETALINTTIMPVKHIQRWSPDGQWPRENVGHSRSICVFTCVHCTLGC